MRAIHCIYPQPRLHFGSLVIGKSASKGNSACQPAATLVRAKCPPHHLIGMAWIATPYNLTLDEAHAYRVFETLGAWRASIAA